MIAPDLNQLPRPPPSAYLPAPAKPPPDPPLSPDRHAPAPIRPHPVTPHPLSRHPHIHQLLHQNPGHLILLAIRKSLLHFPLPTRNRQWPSNRTPAEPRAASPPPDRPPPSHPPPDGTAREAPFAQTASRTASTLPDIPSPKAPAANAAPPAARSRIDVYTQVQFTHHRHRRMIPPLPQIQPHVIHKTSLLAPLNRKPSQPATIPFRAATERSGNAMVGEKLMLAASSL